VGSIPNGIDLVSGFVSGSPVYTTFHTPVVWRSHEIAPLKQTKPAMHAYCKNIIEGDYNSALPRGVLSALSKINAIGKITASKGIFAVDNGFGTQHLGRL
jgi:hypothetical protein